MAGLTWTEDRGKFQPSSRFASAASSAIWALSASRPENLTSARIYSCRATVISVVVEVAVEVEDIHLQPAFRPGIHSRAATNVRDSLARGFHRPAERWTRIGPRVRASRWRPNATLAVGNPMVRPRLSPWLTMPRNRPRATEFPRRPLRVSILQRSTDAGRGQRTLRIGHRGERASDPSRAPLPGPPRSRCVAAAPVPECEVLAGDEVDVRRSRHAALSRRNRRRSSG